MKKFVIPSAVLVVAVALIALLAWKVSANTDTSSLDARVARHDYPLTPGYHQRLPLLGTAPPAEAVICGIPLVLLAREAQRGFVAAMDALAPGRGFLHYSYCVTSPLPARALGLAARRVAWTPRNFPPASLWRYTPA